MGGASPQGSRRPKGSRSVSHGVRAAVVRRVVPRNLCYRGGRGGTMITDFACALALLAMILSCAEISTADVVELETGQRAEGTLKEAGQAAVSIGGRTNHYIPAVALPRLD